MKNCFGITPCTIYGDGAGENEPGQVPRGGPQSDPLRRPPAVQELRSPENDPASPRDGGYRVPRIVADLVAARPIHLAIVDGIETMTGGEVGGTPKFHVRPGVLLAGTNCVTVDAVGTAVMGFDPMADRGIAALRAMRQHAAPGEELGVGTRDLKRIEVLGERIADLMFDYRKSRGGGWPNAPRPA